MKSKVKLSFWSSVLTICVVILIGYIAFVTYHDNKFPYLLILLILIVISGLFFAPTAIVASDKSIVIKTALNKMSIPMEEIASVENFQPMMTPFKTARIRLFSSGGFLGYWGVFYDPVIGKFNGYFGDSKSCFLLIKKDGEKYVLGCQNSKEMVDYIQSHLKKLPM